MLLVSYGYKLVCADDRFSKPFKKMMLFTRLLAV